jgi:hypothetical protein
MGTNNRLEFKTIGCDPELFFIDRSTGRPYSAEGIVPGTKEDPYYISERGHMIQLDNVLVEFGIPPVSTLESFKTDIKYVLDYLRDRYGDRFALSTLASADMDESQLQSDQAKLFGCDSDYNCWKECINDPPKPAKTLRSAGGHLHIGVKDEDFELDQVFDFIKLCDLTLGVPSVILDKDTRRKQLYGKAGAFRFKPYFAEYRVLSNFWIHSEKMMDFVFKNLMLAFEIYNTMNFEKIFKEDGESIVSCINNNNEDIARKLIDKYKLL